MVLQEQGLPTHIYVSNFEGRKNEELTGKAFCLVACAEGPGPDGQLNPLRHIRPLLTTPFHVSLLSLGPIFPIALYHGRQVFSIMESRHRNFADMAA